MDLGVSSMQIDRVERGFSYATDAPLDMRMDASSDLTAADILNTWDERRLADTFRSLVRSGSVARSPARSCAAARREGSSIGRVTWSR